MRFAVWLVVFVEGYKKKMKTLYGLFFEDFWVRYCIYLFIGVSGCLCCALTFDFICKKYFQNDEDFDEDYIYYGERVSAASKFRRMERDEDIRYSELL